MNDGMYGIFVLIVIATICSLFFHYIIRQYRVAVIVSGIAGTLLFQLAVYLQAGYLDPFFPIASLVSFLIICAISSLIFLIKQKVFSN